MTSGGRPRREDERPDSRFGRLLKDYIWHAEDFVQADLAAETGISERALSNMVKGERKSGHKLRRDLRSIVRVLHEREVLTTLDQANELITSIPGVGPLHEDDPEDAKIITLFNTPPVVGTRFIASASPSHNAPFEDREDTAEPDTEPEPERPPLPETPPPAPEPRYRRVETKERLWRYLAPIAAAIVIIVAGILTVKSIFLQPLDCPTNGVTVYAEPHERGQCYTFGVGDYQLAKAGLAQQVSSIRNPHDGYHIILYDKQKNFYYIDKDMPVIPAEWDKRADEIHIEKHRPTSCNPGSDGIIAFIDQNYAGGCLFITHDIPDLTTSNFDSVLVSIQFVGSYRYTRQLLIYTKPNYQGECGSYWQDQSDLERCARIALSVRVLPFTPPTPIPTVIDTHYAGNVASVATITPGGTGALIDGSLQTEWIGGHQVGFVLHWPFPVVIHRVVVWDRKQSPTENNQINKLKLIFSDGTATGDIDMKSDGPRCADIALPEKTITSLQVMPTDASGNNGFREIEIWATTGPQYSNNSCVNKKTIAHTIPL